MSDHHGRHRHKAETAGHLALTRVPVLPETMAAGAARARLTTGAYEELGLVILIDAGHRFRGVVELSRLVVAAGDATLGSISARDWPTVTPETDQEHAAELAGAHAVSMLPVVTAELEPVGVLSATLLLEVLVREHREDVNRFVGVLKERAGARHALEDPPLQRVGRRLPWLLAGLAMSTLATGIMASFEHALQSNVALAFFIPAIVYLTDAIGTQTEAIAVRGLSARRKPLFRLLLGEAATGAAIGLILGVFAAIGIGIAFGNLAIGIGVGVTLMAAGTLASGIGLLLPWSLSRLGIDPAFGAGPVATIVQDLLTIVVYFVVMTRLIGLGG